MKMILNQQFSNLLIFFRHDIKIVKSRLSESDYSWNPGQVFGKAKMLYLMIARLRDKNR